jgi:hypothetical protein
MNRRILLLRTIALAAFAAWPPSAALAHTPYRQWDIFRRRHLQVLTARSDLDGDLAGDEWVAHLREHLPLSRAIVSRARDIGRVASLLKTDQAKLAVMSYADVQAMALGIAPFNEYAPMPVQLLLDNGTHLLIARDNMPLHHAYVITVSLLEARERLHLQVPMAGRFGLDVHAGARAAALGELIQAPARADGA